MANNLRPNSSLSSQTRNSNDARQDSSDFGASLMTKGRGIGEETAVFVVYDKDWKVRMGVCEFVEEFAVEGAVDGCPE